MQDDIGLPAPEPGHQFMLSIGSDFKADASTIVPVTSSPDDFDNCFEPQERLGHDSERWIDTIQALLTTRSAPSEPSRALEQLRQTFRHLSCSSSPKADRTPGSQP